MHNSIKAFQIRPAEHPQVFANLRDLRQFLSELAAGEQVGIQAHYLITCGAKYGAGDGANVAFMPS